MHCWEMLARPLKGNEKRQYAQIGGPMRLILDTEGCSVYKNQVKCWSSLWSTSQSPACTLGTTQEDAALVLRERLFQKAQ